MARIAIVSEAVVNRSAQSASGIMLEMKTDFTGEIASCNQSIFCQDTFSVALRGAMN